MTNQEELIAYMIKHDIDVSTLQKDIGIFTVTVTIQKNELVEVEE